MDREPSVPKPVAQKFPPEADVVSNAIEEAIIDNNSFLQNFWAWINRDDKLGSTNFRFNQDQLMTRLHADFSKRWDGRVRDDKENVIGKTGDGDWELFGHIDATVVPPPQQLQIVCIRSSQRFNRPYRITDVGVLEDGVIRMMSKREVIRMIEDGNNFFVVGPDGSSVNVKVHYPLPTESINYTYIYTSPDGKTQNNLLSLPRCR